ncbi:MAG: A24 family peptidase, partial [Nanoarchaeota archaeon]
MKELVAIAIALSALFAGTITDIKKREVPDWLNYGLMFTGFALSGMASILYFEPGYILESIAGFLFFFILGTLLFYTGQWGGGDTKMLMGLGALIGLQIQIPANLNQIPFLIVFLVCTLIAGAAYGLVWTIYMGIKKRKTFSKNLKKKLTEKRIVYIKYALLIVMALLFALAVTAKEMRFIFLLLALAFPLLFYLSVFIKIIEKECMIKKISPDKLTEGDWIEEEIMENKKKVCPKKILTRKDIEKINKIKNEHTAEIKRKYLFFWIKKTVDISEI